MAQLRELLADAQNGDTFFISGDIASDGALLTCPVPVHIESEGGATLRNLHLSNASITFANVALADGLIIDGASNVLLGYGVNVSGEAGKPALVFSGSGTLIIEPGCSIQGGASAAGLSIVHDGGAFYGSIEGQVIGGSGATGGAGLIISPLQAGGAVMITGSIRGGSGTSLGGHALNLYDLSGNAYITVDGAIEGGSGMIGGDGIQLVSADGHVSVGVSGEIKGGRGELYGGNAMIMLNAEGASSVNLSGHFYGGDVTSENAQPGASLNLVGESASLRAHIDNCILEEGRILRESEPVTPSASEPASVPEATPGEAI